ncbi:MAG: ROK family protein [Erysipelotrichaceae bacterium]|nr:ROK family protein [Erysipelotrichaceae bacterium]
MKLMVFDAGGTEIKYGIVEDGTIITEKGWFPTPTDCFESFLEQVSNVYFQHKDEVEGIAMSIPGPVDVLNGIVHGNNAMKYKHDIHVAQCISEKCGCPAVIDNDAKAAILAEHRYGALKGCSNAAVFVIGTAVGGGFIINGQIVRGATFNAGEFSFVNTEADDYANDDKILGQKCSTSFLLKSYRQRTGRNEEIDGREFFRRLPSDPYARAALDELSLNIAIQLYNIYWLLDLEKVAIGGGISQQPVLIEKIRENYAIVEKNSYQGRHHTFTGMEIVPCEFRNDANLIGAFITYRDKLHNK